MYQAKVAIDMLCFPVVKVAWCTKKESNGGTNDWKNVWWQVDFIDNGLRLLSYKDLFCPFPAFYCAPL